MADFDDSVRFTWYLSPELNRLEHLKIADGFMAAAVDEALNTLKSRLDFTVTARPLVRENSDSDLFFIGTGAHQFAYCVSRPKEK